MPQNPMLRTIRFPFPVKQTGACEIVVEVIRDGQSIFNIDVLSARYPWLDKKESDKIVEEALISLEEACIRAGLRIN